MGWWSATIMGGDTPLDYQGDFIYDICDIDQDEYYDKGLPAFRSILEDKTSEMVERAELADDPIAYQVLGVQLMGAGATISDDLIETIINAASEDEWALEGDPERIQFIDDFKTALRNYDRAGGTPVEVTREGLFEKIFDAMAK